MNKSKAPEAAEPRFQITMVIAARHVGGVIAFLDNKTEAFDIHLVKDIEPGRNAPRGSFKDSVTELLKNGGMPIGDFKTKMRSFGFTPATVQTQVYKMIKDGDLIRNKKNIIRISATAKKGT